LQAELSALGARVTLAACDVSDRDQLVELIGSVPEQHPLTAVVHAAGVLDDGVLGSLTSERLDRVLAPKLDGALHLHELTKHLDLAAFVLFSSVIASIGGVGQGNYAAANAGLDALAAARRAQGLVGTSLAWGLWALPTGMSAALSEADLTRLTRAGLGALSAQEGLELFDLACDTDEALAIPARLDIAALRARATAGTLAPLLRGLVRMPARRAAQAAGGTAGAGTPAFVRHSRRGSGHAGPGRGRPAARRRPGDHSPAALRNDQLGGGVVPAAGRTAR